MFCNSGSTTWPPPNTKLPAWKKSLNNPSIGRVWATNGKPTRSTANSANGAMVGLKGSAGAVDSFFRYWVPIKPATTSTSIWVAMLGATNKAIAVATHKPAVSLLWQKFLYIPQVASATTTTASNFKPWTMFWNNAVSVIWLLTIASANMMITEGNVKPRNAMHAPPKPPRL